MPANVAFARVQVHWGYFSKLEAPKLTITSGETVKVEMASHHACDDYDKMISGDAGMESISSTPRRGISRSKEDLFVLYCRSL